jgi:hypothetical protein
MAYEMVRRINGDGGRSAQAEVAPMHPLRVARSVI